MNRNTILTYAAAQHSLAARRHGWTSEEAKAALAALIALENTSEHPIDRIVMGALRAFVDTLHNEPAGMRIGGGNPRDRLEGVLDKFTEFADATEGWDFFATYEPVDFTDRDAKADDEDPIF